MANTVDKVLKIALSEVGYLEKKTNKDLYNKTANAGDGNYTKYNKEMHDLYPSVMDFPAEWCDAFVDWCFQNAYGVSNAKGLLGGDFNDYTPSSANLYKNKGAWHTSNPNIGDQIFFKNSSRICHTGLVYDVDSKYVYTVEGNVGGAVVKRQILLTDSSIAGYGRPKYDIAPSLSKTVKWNGITTTALNVRTGAGVEYPLCSFAPLKKGTVVGVCDSAKASNGVVWYYIKYNNQYGFASSKYIQKTTTTTNNNTSGVDSAASYSGSIAGTYKTTTALNLRAGAGTNKKIQCVIPKGGKVDCYGYYSTFNGVKWYLVTYGKYTGFASSKYFVKQ